jgi:putative heme iron utilization protein
MSFTRHVYKKLNFVHSQATGTIDDNDYLVHILAFQVESKNMEYVRELLDFRHVRNADSITVNGLIRMAAVERERSKDRDFLLAILVSTQLLGQFAEVFARIIATINLKVKVFSGDVDGALSWLGYEDTEKTKIRRFIGKHSLSAADC